MVLFIMIIHVFICLCVSHLYSLMYFADDVSISGFKDVISEQSTAESAIEAATGQEHEGGESPDSASAASQSIDEPTKDTVRNSGTIKSQHAQLIRFLNMYSSPPGVSAGVEGAVGVCGHGGHGREHSRGSGGGPGHTQPAGKCQPQTVPEQPQPG